MIMTFERQGSSKDISTACNERGETLFVRFGYSNGVSILDRGRIPGVEFEDLGRLRCAIAGNLFERMRGLFNTHYISHNVAEATMDVRPFRIKELGVNYRRSYGRILGVEIIDRRQVTKKLVTRVEMGSLEPSRLLSSLADRDLVPGAMFSPPFIECTTKFEPADRYVTDAEAAMIAEVELSWLLETCYPEIRRASEFLSQVFEGVGFNRHDGKFEGAISQPDTFVFVDSLSPDEMRLVGEDGKSYDKDLVREWYQDTFPEWYAEVLAAKKEHPEDKSKWPPYPDQKPPASVRGEVAGRYRAVAEALGAM